MNVDINGNAFLKNLWNGIKNIVKEIKKHIVFEYGYGVGADVKLSTGVLGVGLGYSKDITTKHENNKKIEGSSTNYGVTLDFISSQKVIGEEYFHEYHSYDGDLDKTIIHQNPLPFVTQIKDCEYTTKSKSLFFSTTESDVGISSEEDSIFIGIDASWHVGVGGHIKIGFSIPWN